MLKNGVNKWANLYCVAVKTDTNEYFFDIPYKNSMTFILPLELVEKWIEYNEGIDSQSYTKVDLEGKMVKGTAGDNIYWIFGIQKIEVRSWPDGEVIDTFEVKK